MRQRSVSDGRTNQRSTQGFTTLLGKKNNVINKNMVTQKEVEQFVRDNNIDAVMADEVRAYTITKEDLMSLPDMDDMLVEAIEADMDSDEVDELIEEKIWAEQFDHNEE